MIQALLARSWNHTRITKSHCPAPGHVRASNAHRLSQILLAITLITVMTSCSGGEQESKRPVSDSAEGPLSGGVGAGGSSLDPPAGRTRWFGTFGAFVLCRKNDAIRIELERVRYRIAERPISVTPMLRSFSLAELQPLSRSARADFNPVLAALGRPPRFDQPYATELSMPGNYTSTIAGLEITPTCKEKLAAEDALSTGRIPSTTFTELMFVLEVDRDGGRVDKAFVDYLANGKPRTLRLDWEMAACGSAIQNQNLCAQG